jgi:hypothetical protein
MTPSEVVDAHYAAYGAGDLDVLLATLDPDFQCRALNGDTWADGHEEAARLYRSNMVDYPLSLNTDIGAMTVGKVVIRRESTKAADPSRPTGEVLAIYTVEGDLITCLDMAVEPGDDAASVAVAEAQLVAYNAQDLDAHVACFAPRVEVANLGEAPNLTGQDAYRERMGGVFAQFPDNRVELLGRLACRGVVCDHERVFRGGDVAPFEVIAIYTIRNGLIARVDFVR